MHSLLTFKFNSFNLDPLLYVATPILKIFPRCRVWERPLPPTLFHSNSHRIASEINYIEAMHMDLGVPRSLLSDLVSGAHQEESLRRKRDPTRGNVLQLLYSIDNGITSRAVQPRHLVLPGGILGNELCE